MVCHHCGSEIKIERRRVGRADECPDCSSDLHCCLNCANYDTGAHNRCREPQSDWVSDRERANFCDFFLPNAATASGTSGSRLDPRSAFDSLFKK
jgi:hypothetical protein